MSNRHFYLSQRTENPPPSKTPASQDYSYLPLNPACPNYIFPALPCGLKQEKEFVESFLRIQFFDCRYQHFFYQIHHAFLLDKAHLQIKLSKFRLSVPSRVFVSQTLGNLKIFFHTS